MFSACSKQSMAECRICLEVGKLYEGRGPLSPPATDTLLSPCRCTGSMAAIHFVCLRRLRQMDATKYHTCPVCLTRYTFFADSGYADIPQLLVALDQSVFKHLVVPGNLLAYHIMSTIVWLQLFGMGFAYPDFVWRAYLTAKSVLYVMDVAAAVWMFRHVRNAAAYAVAAVNSASACFAMYYACDVFLDYRLVCDGEAVMHAIPFAYIITNMVHPLLVPIMFIFHMENVRRMNQRIMSVWD